MEKRVYQELASAINARKTCKDRGNTEWLEKWDQRVNEIIGNLPHGSGLDGTWSLDEQKTSDNRLVLNMEYHAMDENGFYDGYIPFSVTVNPSLMFGITLTITGRFGKYQDIKDYLYDILNQAFCEITDAHN